MVAETNAVFFAGKFINGFMIGIIGTVMIGYIGEALTSISPYGFYDGVLTLMLLTRSHPSPFVVSSRVVLVSPTASVPWLHS